MSKACRLSVAGPLAALVFALVFVLAACAGGRERDTSAACDPACGAFQACCEGADGVSSCRPIANDPNNCGGCGIVCPSGTCMSSMCVAGGGDSGPGFDSGPTGSCSPTCASGQRCCGTTCVNRSVPTGTDGTSDPSFENCNGCGLRCDPERASACSSPAGGGAPECLCGNFDECTAPDVCAMGSSGTFQCVNLSTDKNNCGEVGNVCPGEEICSAGTCVCGSGSACSEGQTCCGGSCIDTQSDAANCGGCGVDCVAEGGDSCVAGECRCGSGPGCTPPSGTSLGELCCSGTCVTQGNTNCGSCGTMCTGDDTCIMGGGIIPGTGGDDICCGTSFGGLGGFCSGFGFGDGGFGLGDGGLPFP